MELKNYGKIKKVIINVIVRMSLPVVVTAFLLSSGTFFMIMMLLV